MKEINLSIIIPNYNEEKNLNRKVLEQIAKYLKAQRFTWEVLISDDGSTDNSLAIIEEFAKRNKNFKLIRNPHAGKPFALKSAINKAKGKFILLTDMDQSTPITEISKLLPWTKKGYNVVIGSRGRRRSDAPWYRQMISLGFWFIRKSIILPEIVDTQCGFKIIKTSLARNIFKKMRLFHRGESAVGWKVTAYDVEMLHIAKVMKEKIKEVRVIWRDEDIAEGKNRNFVKESYEMLFEVMRVRINDILGRYA